MVRCSRIFVMAMALFAARVARGVIIMPHLFTSHCVLQRHAAVPVWGRAAPGSTIVVRFAGQHVSSSADSRGNWIVRLSPMRADAHGRDMTITGDGRLVIHDVVVGDVWLCSGQSNMQFPLNGWWAKALHARRETAAANFPLIRLLKVPRVNSPEAQEDFVASWKPCTPSVARNFSAVSYFFGRDMFQRLHVPIGLIDASYGGTVIESWTPMSALRRTPALHGDVAWFGIAAARYKKQLRHYHALMRSWVREARRNRAAGRAAPLKPHIRRPQNPFTLSRPSPDMAPVCLFNAMIHPLIPFAIRGVAWCQGENNAWVDDPLYGVRLNAMIQGWRRDWNAPELPLLIVQIAPYFHYPKPAVGVPIVWQGEEDAVKHLPAVGMVGTMDIGDLHNIHFRNKQAVGSRLARLALAMVYHRSALRTLGPMYKSMTIRNGRIHIAFSGVQNGLKSRDGKPLDWFEISGAARHFIPAMARIDGRGLVVWSPHIAHPVAVRFGFTSQAQPNLMDGRGMPVLPFRTDHWPLH